MHHAEETQVMSRVVLTVGSSLVRESVAAVFALQVPMEPPPHHPRSPSVISSILQDNGSGGRGGGWWGKWALNP